MADVCTLITAILSPVALILVALIEMRASRDRKVDQAYKSKTERREHQRAEESRLGMQMMDASLELGVATALAVECGKMNGEMHSAKDSAAKAREEYKSFIHKLASAEIAKM